MWRWPATQRKRNWLERCVLRLDLVFCFGCSARESCLRTGATQTVWLIRLTSSVLTAALILAARKPIKPPTDRVAGWILGMGLTDTGAFVMNNFGMRIEQSPSSASWLRCMERSR